MKMIYYKIWSGCVVFFLGKSINIDNQYTILPN